MEELIKVTEGDDENVGTFFLPYDLIYMWNLKKTHTKLINREQIGGGGHFYKANEKLNIY